LEIGLRGGEGVRVPERGFGRGYAPDLYRDYWGRICKGGADGIGSGFRSVSAYGLRGVALCDTGVSCKKSKG
jgi:hypothetical protein